MKKAILKLNHLGNVVYPFVIVLNVLLCMINFNSIWQQDLRWTSTIEALEVSLPTLFFATHRYSPLSLLLTFVIINCFLSSEKLILELWLVFTGCPWMVHDIVGTGLPLALQDKVMFCPSLIVTPIGWVMIEGCSEQTQQKENKQSVQQIFRVRIRSSSEASNSEFPEQELSLWPLFLYS